VANTDAHHHDHPDFLAHHFETPKQQFEAGKLGMWLFIATEILLFGGLFCGYSVWRGNHPDLFEYSSHYLDTILGGINTAVLIASSLTMAIAVTLAQKNDPVRQDKKPWIVLMLVLTLAGAATFMVIKYFEYSHKFNEGLYPGLKLYEKPAHAHDYWSDERDVATPAMTAIDTMARAPQSKQQLGLPETITVELPATGDPAEAPAGINRDRLSRTEQRYAPTGSEAREQARAEADDAKAASGDHDKPPHPIQDPTRPHNPHVFFNIYYMMTGLHGIHVIAGGIVIAWLLVRTLKGHFHRDYFTPVDLGGLYWHVVDLIWIFLFPLFYLIH